MWIFKTQKTCWRPLSSRSQYVCNSMKIFDFSTLDTTIPHTPLKSRIKELIKRCFSKKNREQGISILLLVETCLSSVLMRFLCKTSHKDSCAWPCLAWHCQPIKSAEYNHNGVRFYDCCSNINCRLSRSKKVSNINFTWILTDFL